MLPDEPGTKVNQCVDNIMQIWRDGEADKLTQLVFCDISTPQAKAPASKAAKTLDNPLLHALEGAVPLPEQEPVFTVYDDIRQKLIAQGMPADQIAFIHEANTEVRKRLSIGASRRKAHGKVGLALAGIAVSLIVERIGFVRPGNVLSEWVCRSSHMGVSRRTASVSADKHSIVPLCVLVNIPGKKKSLNKRCLLYTSRCV